MIVDGYKLVCHGAQNIRYKKKYCKSCDIFERKKYPLLADCWRVCGTMHHGGKCNIKKALGI